MIAKDGNVVWCQSCASRAATSFCEKWLCGSCYAKTHVRDPDGNLHHALRGDVMSNIPRSSVIVQFAADGSPLLRRSGSPPKRRG